MVLAIRVGAADGFQFRAPIRAGSLYAHSGTLLPGQHVEPGAGYDGQFYFYLAEDPFLIHGYTTASLDNTFRVRRWLYPALAFLLSGGHRAVLPYVLVGINLFTLSALAWLLALAASRAGQSPWLALLPIAYAGTWIPILLDLAEPLQLVLLAAGLLVASSSLLFAAALAKETAGVVLATEAARAYRERDWPALKRRLAAAAVYLAWALLVFTLVRGPQFNTLGAHFLDPAGAPFLVLVKSTSNLLTALPAVFICCAAVVRLAWVRDGAAWAAGGYALLALGAGYDTWLDPAAFYRVTAGAVILIYLSWCSRQDVLGLAAMVSAVVAGATAAAAVFG